MSGVEKPQFRIPLMAEISKQRRNGLKAISTFSGCGGSSLGLTMAGFKVIWASEFIPAAREVYRANFPSTIVDERDIREVTADEILSRVKMRPGELDLLDGSPPCASFSTAGKREKSWGEVKSYSDTKQRVDDLFFEYARIVDGVRPKVFIAENVPGLTIGKAKGVFKEIFRALEALGYHVEARILDSQWLGVPQTRRRLFFQGVRADVWDSGRRHAWPKPLPYRYTLLEVIGERVFHGTSGTHSQGDATDYKVESLEGYAIAAEARRLPRGGGSEKYLNLIRSDPNKPSPTITASGGTSPGTAGPVHYDATRKFTIEELKRICSFPDDFQLTGTYAQQWERLGRAVPPLMMRALAKAIADEAARCAEVPSE